MTPPSELPVDLAPVVAEVAAAFDRYEAALVVNDRAVLDELFWASPLTVRFGIADQQSGHQEVARWRATQGPLPGRTLADTRIVTFGEDLAVATTTFSYPGRPALGRQTQVWVRTAPGWRIASAHVSEVPTDAR
ncbi:MAG TPA: AtzH-like domain-containing protein [Acidimicrobiales bacterium]|nr:AtzH-like domain-containing protein [Acidimicrobiales bacterium]